MSTDDVLELTARLDALPDFAPSSVERVLGAKPQRDAAESDSDLAIYRRTADSPSPWRSLELRLPAQTPSRRGLLILTLAPGAEIPMELVEKRFGKEHTFSPPNPRAVDRPTAYYTYKRKQGVLRVVFPGFERYHATAFVLDRME